MALSAIGLLGTSVGATVPVACTASGTKALAMSEAQVCARFVAALGAEMRAKLVTSAVRPVDGYAVELRFLPIGVASAKVARLRRGQPQEFPTYELAVSDRKMLSTDIDKLAADVARGIVPVKSTRRR